MTNWCREWFVGIIDLVTLKAYSFDGKPQEIYQEIAIPDHLKAEVDQRRAMLIEELAHHNDELLEKYLEGQEISVPEIKKVIRELTIQAEFFPVLCGSAFKNKGVKLMLDAVVDYLPSPLEVPAIKGILPNAKK